jgi:hypothetical protein
MTGQAYERASAVSRIQANTGVGRVLEDWQTRTASCECLAKSHLRA